MATTTKTLTPTNQQITLPDMTERPNNSVQVDSIGKLADAVNALNSDFVTQHAQVSVPSDVTGGRVDVYKLAGFVFFSIIVNKSNWAEGDTVAIIPNGYRPIMNVYVPFMNYNSTTNNNFVNIDVDGNIKIWSKGTQPSGNIYITAAYLAA